MKGRSHHFRSGVSLTLLLALAATVLARMPVVENLGPLALALLLGIAWRLSNHVSMAQRPGIGFSARRLLRWGIILLGVRLNFDLLMHAGVRVVLIDLTVVTCGLIGISWLGRCLGLDSRLAMLIAVDTSICGASAVAAAVPATQAREEDAGLAIPLGSLLGTIAMLGFTAWQHFHPLSPQTYGVLTGSTLHEIAQVMAAVQPVDGAVEIGTIAKLTRVVLLVPAVFTLGWLTARRSAGREETRRISPPWFVLGFLLVAGINTLFFRSFPVQQAVLVAVGNHVISVATFLMTMSMAAMGLEMDLKRLRANAFRASATAVLGWLGLASMVALEIAYLSP